MSLQHRLDAFKVEFEAKVPGHAVAVMHRSTNDLIASNQAGKAAKAGDVAPSFSLNDQD